jgi:hypothetical protein
MQVALRNIVGYICCCGFPTCGNLAWQYKPLQRCSTGRGEGVGLSPVLNTTLTRFWTTLVVVFASCFEKWGITSSVKPILCTNCFKDLQCSSVSLVLFGYACRQCVSLYLPFSHFSFLLYFGVLLLSDCTCLSFSFYNVLCFSFKCVLFVTLTGR